ncbi:hypothetical protein Syun_002464 [Stephania yunnanensis]|uniref:Late embryogenesis abundant protein LEA-2 subgroup domain-containing protein n=1 Tax=Stephania yunnanensis TaxID=152371 RepID=A0AAP0LJR7_9MAGN
MSSSTDDRNKPVTGYPATAVPYNPNGYPQAAAAAAPPPPTTTPNPQPYYPPRPRNTTFLRRLIIAGIAALLIVGAITFIVWIVLRPKLPVVILSSASLTSLSANSSLSQLSANWDVSLLFRNPNNKIKLFYDQIDASVFYRSDFLADTALPPMYVAKRNETRLAAGFSARSVYVSDKALRALLDERGRGAVSFNLRMLAGVRFKAGAWRTRRRLMRVFCGDVKIGVSSNGAGALIGGAKECEVSV